MVYARPFARPSETPPHMLTLKVQTSRRAQFVDITAAVRQAARNAGRPNGLVTVFVPHTTAGITINENADPAVCRDLLGALEQLVPRDAPDYTHAEGNSDAHLKASLLGSSVHVILADGDLRLGTWQGIYLAEFDGPRQREVWVTVTG